MNRSEIASALIDITDVIPKEDGKARVSGDAGRALIRNAVYALSQLWDDLEDAEQQHKVIA